LTWFAGQPEWRRLSDNLWARDVLLVRWVDWLARNYADVCDGFRESVRCGVVIRTGHQLMTSDKATKYTMQQAERDALDPLMAGTTRAQAKAIRKVQRASIAHAKAQRDERTDLGRKPSLTRAQLDIVRKMLRQSAGFSTIAAATGLTRQTLFFIEDDPGGSEVVLAR
jgi:putative DNA-invertase from lambdoid prophage Rac